MKQGIFMMAYNRPKYLRVSLEAVSKCHNVDKWDVFVDYDGGGDGDFSVCDGVMDHYSIERKQNLGNMRHAIELYKTAIKFGYERILYIEDDHLVSSDCLDYLDTVPNTRMWESFYFHGPSYDENDEYVSDSPSLLNMSDARWLVDNLESKAYVGLPNICARPHVPIKDDEKWFDICVFALTKARNARVGFPRKHFSLNFGYVGCNNPYEDFNTQAFKGNPNEWFKGVLDTVNTEPFKSICRTKGFKYV